MIYQQHAPHPKLVELRRTIASKDRTKCHELIQAIELLPLSEPQKVEFINLKESFNAVRHKHRRIFPQRLKQFESILSLRTALTNNEKEVCRDVVQKLSDPDECNQAVLVLQDTLCIELFNELLNNPEARKYVQTPLWRNLVVTVVGHYRVLMSSDNDTLIKKTRLITNLSQLGVEQKVFAQQCSHFLLAIAQDESMLEKIHPDYLVDLILAKAIPKLAECLLVEKNLARIRPALVPGLIRTQEDLDKVTKLLNTKLELPDTQANQRARQWATVLLLALIEGRAFKAKVLTSVPIKRMVKRNLLTFPPAIIVRFLSHYPELSGVVDEFLENRNPPLTLAQYQQMTLLLVMRMLQDPKSMRAFLQTSHTRSEADIVELMRHFSFYQPSLHDCLDVLVSSEASAIEVEKSQCVEVWITFINRLLIMIGKSRGKERTGAINFSIAFLRLLTRFAWVRIRIEAEPKFLQDLEAVLPYLTTDTIVNFAKWFPSLLGVAMENIDGILKQRAPKTVSTVKRFAALPGQVLTKSIRRIQRWCKIEFSLHAKQGLREFEALAIQREVGADEEFAQRRAHAQPHLQAQLENYLTARSKREHQLNTRSARELELQRELQREWDQLFPSTEERTQGGITPTQSQAQSLLYSLASDVQTFDRLIRDPRFQAHYRALPADLNILDHLSNPNYLITLSRAAFVYFAGLPSAMYRKCEYMAPARLAIKNNEDIYVRRWVLFAIEVLKHGETKETAISWAIDLIVAFAKKPKAQHQVQTLLNETPAQVLASALPQLTASQIVDLADIRPLLWKEISDFVVAGLSSKDPAAAYFIVVEYAYTLSGLERVLANPAMARILSQPIVFKNLFTRLLGNANLYPILSDAASAYFYTLPADMPDDLPSLMGLVDLADLIVRGRTLPRFVELCESGLTSAQRFDTNQRARCIRWLIGMLVTVWQHPECCEAISSSTKIRLALDTQILQYCEGAVCEALARIFPSLSAQLLEQCPEKLSDRYLLSVAKDPVQMNHMMSYPSLVLRLRSNPNYGVVLNHLLSTPDYGRKLTPTTLEFFDNVPDDFEIDTPNQEATTLLCEKTGSIFHLQIRSLLGHCEASFSCAKFCKSNRRYGGAKKYYIRSLTQNMDFDWFESLVATLSSEVSEEKAILDELNALYLTMNSTLYTPVFGQPEEFRAQSLPPQVLADVTHQLNRLSLSDPTVPTDKFSEHLGFRF